MKNAKKIDKKEVDVMNTAVEIRSTEVEFIKEMDHYIEKLRQQQTDSVDTAYKEAMDALLRTGVVNKNGKPKEKIVSWE